MFGIGSTELIVILIVALIVLGPKSLAKFAKSLGKAMGEFRKVSTDFQRTLNYEAAQDDIRAKEEAYKNMPGKKEDLSDNAASDNEHMEQPYSDTSGHKTESPIINNFPPDSPVARAIANARLEADSTEAYNNKKDSEFRKSGESHV